MSSYQQTTIHPETKQIENAEWLDDYFGQHNYGVRFPSDGKVFRADHFNWQKNPQTLALEGTPTVSTPTVEQTEKGDRFANPMHTVEEHGDGKRTTTTKHEDGRQDVKIDVTRLDLKDPTEEDKKSAEAIEGIFKKTKVGVLVIHAPTRDKVYFTCPLSEVRRNSKMVMDQYLKQKTGLGVLENGNDVYDQFIIVESAVVDQVPKVSKLYEKEN